MARSDARVSGQPSRLLRQWRWTAHQPSLALPGRNTSAASPAGARLKGQPHRVLRHPAVALLGAVAATVATMYLISWLLATLWPAGL